MALRYNFIQIDGAGRLALSERPKIKEIKQLKADNCDRVVTLLAGRGEHAGLIGSEVKACGMQWDWVKIARVTHLTPSEETAFKQAMIIVTDAISVGESVIIHCSAGLHRTGILAYAVLRNSGLSHDESLDMIGEMRTETLTALDAKYLNVAKKLSF